jgi:hypothetical protein
MASKDEEGEHHLSLRAKQRRDSGFAPPCPDKENHHTEALSSAKFLRTAHTLADAGYHITTPMLSSKGFPAQARDQFPFTEDSRIQGEIFCHPSAEVLSSLVAADRVHNTTTPMTVPNRTGQARVSRFEDVFEQIRKKNQAALRAPPDLHPNVPSAIATFDHCVKDDATDFTGQVFQSDQATACSDTTSWSSSKNVHSCRSSGIGSNASFKANFTATKFCQTPTRKQEIMQIATWRGPLETREKEASLDTLTANRVSSPTETVLSRAQAIAAIVQAKRAEMEKQFGPGTLRTFYPSNRALERNHILPGRDMNRASTISTRSSSPAAPAAYLGDPFLENNRSADIPEHENCALWICGLPGCVTYNMLLRSIRDIGKVYATVINPPTDSIRTSAAKIIFFNRHQAEKLFNVINDRQFVVMGKVVHKVLWNKIRTGPYPHSTHSRAIRITGTREMMDFDYFENFFVDRFQYDLDVRGVVDCDRPGLVSHEWHFGCLRCQAASAKTAIERELKRIYEVEWVDDPCEFP